jgi:hypothetical protein
MIVVQIGDERFAIHWEIEELPPAAPIVLRKPDSLEVLRKSAAAGPEGRRR